MTATAEHDTTVAIEAWRDQMIDLAVTAYYDYEQSGFPDWETCAILGNALKDIRVRDTLMWRLFNYGDHRVASILLYRVMMAMPARHRAPALTVLAACQAAMGLTNAYAVVVLARETDPDYSFAQLMFLSFESNGIEATAEFLSSVFAELPYDEVRKP